jgi:hypothetical protein
MLYLPLLTIFIEVYSLTRIRFSVYDTVKKSATAELPSEFSATMDVL